MRLILEPRFLFDGSVAASTHKLNHLDVDSTHHHLTTQDAANAANSSYGAEVKAQAVAFDQASAAPAQNPGATSVLFVDPRVANWQTLTAGIASNVQVIVLNDNENGIAQVTEALKNFHDLSSIQFLTYGSSGSIELGNSAVTATTLMSDARMVASWRSHLDSNSDILFWGCDVGEGSAGQNFLNTVHDLTGVGVGASTNATGASSLGGDWTLEATVGDVNASVPFSASARAAYDNVLDTPLPTVTLTGPSSVALGNSFTETVTFQNTASNGVGYGPFIDLFVPASSATGENATLTSATYLGAAVTVTEVTLSTTVAGHVGTLGADHPLAVDSSGNPLFIAAPAGFHAGDLLYVLTLPFGSFTPGQPTASIQLNFSLSNVSELSTTGGLVIAAEGGFEYGADPLNDPATDPSIRGTGSSAQNSDSADGLVTAASNVTLVAATAQVTTWPGEDETATGPSFPGSYTLTLTPAPVTSSDALSNFDATFTLPSDVQYTGGTIVISPGSGSSSGTIVETPSSSTPGGTLQVDFTSLKGPTATTITIPIYVPQDNASAQPILSTSSGAPVTIDLDPIYSYTASNWTPASGSYVLTPQTVAGSGPVDGSGDGTEAVFTAKSLAVQVTSSITNDTGSAGFTPGDTVAYTIHFQLSDYFNLNNLTLSDILGDGVTLNPGTAPVLSITNNGVTTNNISFTSISDSGTTVNGQNVATSGSNSNWGYSRDNVSTGQTTLTFNVGQLLLSTFGTSLLSGGTNGTYGTVTFYTTVLDKYTNSYSGSSLRENDAVSDTASGSGTLINPVGETTIGTVSDTSSDTNTVPEGSLALNIVAVNGVALGNGTVTIQPGDNVTYELVDNLTTGDYGSLNLTGYLPLPVFSVPGSLSADNADTYPTANTYKLVSAPPGGAVQTVTTNTTANSVNFNLGTLDDTSNPSGQKVDIYFTLTASNAPFADGLSLTSEGQSQYTNAAGTVLAATNIQQQVLQEPSLELKTGVASLTNDSDNAKAGTYTIDGGSGSADPTTIFDKAGTTANGNEDSVFSGSIPTAIGNAENLNLAGADGSDEVRIVTTVENTGHGNAYDVTLNGTLPSGYSISNVSNFQITRGDGTVLTYTQPNGSAATAANFFSANGILVDGTGGASTPALYATGDSSHRDILYVTYDLTLASTQAPGATLTAASSVINWASAHGATGFVNNGSPVGESASAITDDATVTTSSATLTKTVTAGNDTGNVPLPNIVPGETATYSAVLSVPEGQMTGGSGDVVFTDQLPANMSYIASSESTSYSSGVSASGGTPGVSYNSSTRTLTVDLGSSLTNTNADASGTVTISYQAQLLNGSNTNGTNLTNNAQLGWSGATLTSSATLTEKDPAVTVGIAANTSGPLYSGETVTYTLTLTDTGGGSVPAQDLTDALSVPAGLTYNGDLTQTGGTSATVNAGAGTIAITQLAAGASSTFTFSATVANNLPSGDALSVAAPATWTSMPGVVTNERTYNGTGSKSLSTGQFTPVISIIGESNDTAGLGTSFAPQTSINASIGDIVEVHAYVQVPEGSNPSTLLDFTLPTGLQFFNDGTATISLVSPGGTLTSTTVGSGAQQSYTGTFGAATATATFAVPSGDIDTSTSGHVKINLGTLTDNESSASPDYVVVEFNAVVVDSSANVKGTAIASNLTVGGQSSGNATITVAEPDVTIAKTVSAISGDTVTYKVVLDNTGNTTAYNVTLADPEGSNQSTISGLASSGGATGLNVTSGNSSSALDATMTLAAGATETFTYQVTVTNPAAPVPNTTGTVTYTSLNGDTQTLNGSTDGTPGSTTGERTGAGGVNDYDASETLGLGTASGRVWQALGSDTTDYSAPDDTGLAGITVTATSPGGITQTTTTAADGSYSFGLLPTGSTTIALPAVGNNGLGATETLVANPDGSVPANPATAGLTLNADSHSGVNFVFRAPDTAPVITSWGGNTSNYTEGGSAIVLSSSGATVADTELNILGGDYAGTHLTIQRYSNSTAAPNAADIFGGSGLLSLSGGNVTYNSTAIGTYTETGGVLTVTMAAGTTATDVGHILNNLAYSNSNTNTLTDGVTIGATLDDNNSSNYQGTGGDKTSAAVYTTINLIPATSSTTFTEPNDSAASASAIAVDGSLTLSDSAGTVLSQATVQVTGNYQAAEDVLAFAPSGSTGNINGSYNATTGTLTLTSAGNTATIAQWQAALRAVTYYDSSDVPNTSTRAVTFSVTDASTGETATANTTDIAVSATNDSPILNTTVSVSLNAATEDVSNVPVGNVGTLVSTLAGTSLNVTDPDGAGLANGGTPGITGIAITTANTSEGNWWYSTNGGTSWTEFAGNGLPAISATNALHLLANASTQIYFQPTVANWNGTVSNALTFRAWDQFDGAANGALSALPTDSSFGTGINTEASAYSSASDSLSLNVLAVNDAPIASGNATLIATSEDTGNPPGDTVANLFTGNFNDSADQQQTVQNPNGSVANTLAGVAVVANTTPASEGVWRYSTDGGTTWTNIAASLSDSSALILPATAKIDFLPVANFNGAPLPLTVRLIDNSNGSLAVSSGVDVSTNGGSTAISMNTVDLATSVTSVNDAPIASGSATLASISADNTSPPGDTVSDLFASLFNDSTDQQRTTLNPTGSVANSFAGIAVTGNMATTAEGVWRYSTDGGATWIDISTSVSDHNALLLPTTAKLSFLPLNGFSGTPDPLTVRLLDNSSGPLSATSGVDVSVNGGITPISAASVELDTSITPVPVLSNPPPAPPPVTPPTELPPVTTPPVASPSPPDTTPTLVIPGLIGMATRLNNPSTALLVSLDNLDEHPDGVELWLAGSVANHFVISNQMMTIEVPASVFRHTDMSEQLTYEATMPDGSPLPKWLHFDARTLTFTGTPLDKDRGTVEVLVTAKDHHNNKAEAQFRILVGDDRHQPVIKQTPAPARAPAKHSDAGHDMRFAQAASTHDTPGTANFSAQLHQAGRARQLTQARAFLNALESLRNPNTPNA